MAKGRGQRAGLRRIGYRPHRDRDRDRGLDRDRTGIAGAALAGTAPTASVAIGEPRQEGRPGSSWGPSVPSGQ
ncbi:hypothetical protein G3I45_19455 [Streptomyces sp. SID339]|uniref:hypothetical protein n=1 Tax=Streptomyces sp. SID10115 TaxID=2706016 RepID=UPI0013DD2B52|nr:hypothetical protein [Streptomyces sp. SID10115]NEB46525.1 hypothetical protein [Streptomyces sp. SID339]